uniref:Uncharacterized protein n=1 Tax=Sinocyclocheilus rhinocerous TaxID=307959 RepID=A0A673LAJ9_9TELE
MIKQIDEGKMCDKLSVIGFSSKVIAWLNSNLTGRVQRVETDGVLSEETIVKNGVLQGSVLGPLLFLLYINDMQAVCDCILFLYAEDSALLVSDRDVGRIQVNLGEELCMVRDWLSENKLLFNIVIILGKVLWISHCRFKTMYARMSFEYSGAQVWKKLPLDIKGYYRLKVF